MIVCRILNKELGKPRKIKRVFYLSKKNILFTDEVIIDMSCYTNDSIRLLDDNEKKLKKIYKEAFKLVNKEEEKLEPFYKNKNYGKSRRKETKRFPNN